MNAPDRIVIVGATSRIAELCARRWAESGARHFSLAGRDGQRLEAIAADLRARAHSAISRSQAPWSGKEPWAISTRSSRCPGWAS